MDPEDNDKYSFWEESEDWLGAENLEKRNNIVEDLQKVEEEVNKVLSHQKWDRETRWGNNWWDVENQYEGSSGTISVKGRADGKVTVQYRANYMEGTPENIDDQIEYLNQEIGLASRQVSPIRNESSGFFVNIDLDEEDDPTVNKRYLKDTVAIMAAADKLIPDTPRILPYDRNQEREF